MSKMETEGSGTGSVTKIKHTAEPLPSSDKLAAMPPVSLIPCDRESGTSGAQGPISVTMVCGWALFEMVQCQSCQWPHPRWGEPSSERCTRPASGPSTDDDAAGPSLGGAGQPAHALIA